MEYKQTWDLSQFLCEDGDRHQNLLSKLNTLLQDIQAQSVTLHTLWPQYTELYQRVSQMGSLVLCIVSCNVKDPKSALYEATMQEVYTAFAALDLQIDQALGTTDLDEELATEPFYPILCERKRRFQEKMAPDKESLAMQFSNAGFHANHTLYQTFIGNLPFTTSKGTFNLSQLENFLSHNERSVRKEAFTVLDTTLQEQSSIFGQLYNNILDFRLTWYRNRKYTSVLHETLDQGRLTEKTLNTLMAVLQQNSRQLIPFLERKAQLLNIDKLAYYDLQAPTTTSGDIPYEQACQTIVTQFQQVSPQMGAFAKQALTAGWADCIPSKTKRNGGFCTEFPLERQSRILLTYENTAKNQTVLAHELGHAFHNHILYSVHPLLQHPPLGLCETASTMAEHIVSEGLLKNASDTEKLFLLEDQLSRAVSFMMDLPSRFLYEKRTHELRQQGYLSTEQLCQISLETQTDGFHQALSTYFPHFWCYKLHYYLTESPFYNWCYSFGYLFSLGIYTHLMEQDNFESGYIALLKDSGTLNVEELAQRHLGVDISEPPFWERACQSIQKDITTFLHLTAYE